jgi:hypothetical protein
MSAQAHHRDGDRGRDEVPGQHQKHAPGGGHPGAGRARQQDKAGAREREHAGGVSARETQRALYGPVDQRFEQELGQGCGHRLGHGDQGRTAPSARRQAGQGQGQGYQRQRHQVTDPGPDVQQSQMTDQAGPDPAVNGPIQPVGPSLVRELCPEGHGNHRAQRDRPGRWSAGGGSQQQPGVGDRQQPGGRLPQPPYRLRPRLSVHQAILGGQRTAQAGPASGRIARSAECGSLTLEHSMDDDRRRAFAEQMITTLTGGALSMLVSVGYRTGLFEAAAT